MDSRVTPQTNETVALVDSVGADTNTNVLSSKDISSLKTESETNVLEEDVATTNELVGTHENLEDKSQGQDGNQGTSPPLVDVSSSFVDTSPALVDTSLVDISTTSPAEMDMQETLVTEEPVKQPIELEGTRNVKTSAISKVLEPSSTRSSPERRHFLTGPIYPPTLPEVEGAPSAGHTSDSDALVDTSSSLADTSPPLADTFISLADTSPSIGGNPLDSAQDYDAMIAIEQQQPGPQPEEETAKPTPDADEDNVASLI